MATIEAAFDKFKDEDGEISLPRLAEVSHITVHSARCVKEDANSIVLLAWCLSLR